MCLQLCTLFEDHIFTNMFTSARRGVFGNVLEYSGKVSERFRLWRGGENILERWQNVSRTVTLLKKSQTGPGKMLNNFRKLERC